jgi:hypothetical protein
LPYARISYASGKEIGLTDSRGRFELEVESAAAKLRVAKPGFADRTINLDEYPDLLDLEIALSRNVKRIEGTQVTQAGQAAARPADGGTIAELEKAQGMSFDVEEHLARLPGISGQEEFSSNVSHYGSRNRDVTRYLGAVQVPAMRHVDIGFPGNLSIINPQVLQSVMVEDDPASGALDQGRAAALRFQPASGDAERFGVRGGLGTSVSEVITSGPWLWGESHIASFRYMDGTFLKNLGEKFFTEYRKREADPAEGELGSGGSDFQLKAWDGFVHLKGVDSTGGTSSLVFLMAGDEWSVRQDTSRSYAAVDQGPSLEIFGGNRDHRVVAYSREYGDGWAWHAGYVGVAGTDRYRDDTLVVYRPPNPDAPRRDGSDNQMNDDRGLMGDLTHSEDHVTVGLERRLPGKLAGGGASWSGEYEWQQETRDENWSTQLKEADVTAHLLRGTGRLQWAHGSWRRSVSAGAVATLDGEAGPQVSGAMARDLGGGWSVESDLGWRSQQTLLAEGLDLATQKPLLESRVKGGASSRLGLQLKRDRLDARLTGFTRWHPEPELPEPEVFWFYGEQRAAEQSLAFGLNAGVEWATPHHWVMSCNASTVRGDYYLKDGGAIPWESSRLLDMSSVIRFYPRTDSLLSLIVRHTASWGQPLYGYSLQMFEWEYSEVDPHTGIRTVTRDARGGERSIRAEEATLDNFRTDVRLHLNLPGGMPPLRSLRFYLEVDNLFSGMDDSALRWLGGTNERQRGWQVNRSGEPAAQTADLVPYVGRGMGLFVQFGVEGSLGF